MLFIAEIGLNHNGNFGLAFEMIRQAKQVDADIAKFQLGWRCGEGEINQITPEILVRIIRWCDHVGIEPMVSLITPAAYEMARPLNFRRYKVASRTVKENLPLVQEIVAEGKETFVSLGMWEGDGMPLSEAENVRYLWCCAKYPAEPWDLTNLPKDFTDSPYDGFSDHSLGIETALLAISRGAEVIEKHFTLDKSDTTIRDHALSATPEEFAELTRLGRAIHRNLKIGI